MFQLIILMSHGLTPYNINALKIVYIYKSNDILILARHTNLTFIILVKLTPMINVKLTVNIGVKLTTKTVK